MTSKSSASQGKLPQSTTTKPTTGNPTDAIARHQHVANAISTATWHLHNGRTEQALGRILSAARHLKQACTELTNGGRA